MDRGIAWDGLGINLLALLSVQVVAPVVLNSTDCFAVDLNVDADLLEASDAGGADLAALFEVAGDTLNALTQLTVIGSVNGAGSLSQLNGLLLSSSCCSGLDGRLSGGGLARSGLNFTVRHDRKNSTKRGFYTRFFLVPRENSFYVLLANYPLDVVLYEFLLSVQEALVIAL